MTVRLSRFVESIYFFFGLYFSSLFAVSYSTRPECDMYLRLRVSLSTPDKSLTVYSSTPTRPPRTPASTSPTPETNTLPVPAGETRLPMEAAVEVMARDLVRDA